MKKNLPLTLIFTVVFIDLLGFGLLIPILPAFATKQLNAPESAVGLVIAAYSFTQFLCNPFFGSLSDKYGRRRIILWTLLINAAGYVMFAFTHTLWMLFLARIVAGVGGSSIGVAQAYIADVTTREERSKGMGLIGVAFGLGFVFGPPLGGLLSHFGYEVTGLVSASFSVLAFLMSLFFLPESRKAEQQAPQIKRKLIDIDAFAKIAKSPSKAIAIMLFFVLTFSVANIYGTFPLLGTEVYGFTDMQNGYIFGIVGIIGAVIQGGLIGRLSKKYPDKTLIRVGAFFLIFGLGFIPFGGNFLGVVLVTIILSIGSGLLQPVLLSLVSKVSQDKEQGMVLGVNQSMASFARMLGPLWGGFAFQYLGYEIPFLTGAFFISLLFIFSVTYLSHHLPEVR